MVYNLFDGLTNEQKSIINDVIESSISFDFPTSLTNDDDSKTINLFLTLKYNFISNEAQLFIENAIKQNINCKEINVFFVENRNDNAKISIDWLNDLRLNYDLNLSVKGEFDKDNLAEELKMLTSKTNTNSTSSPSNNNVIIYTDGACSGNPGAGGWGAILMHGANKKEISGYEKETTNNRMELTAVIKALKMLKAKCQVELYSDSAYVVNAIVNGWLENWKNNNWIGSDKKQVKNIELWQELDSLISYHIVHFNKVKGHADNEFNNRCDELATGEIAKNANK